MSDTVHIKLTVLEEKVYCGVTGDDVYSVGAYSHQGMSPNVTVCAECLRLLEVWRSGGRIEEVRK